MDLAHRGTFFLDEIGELPVVIQAKLLRVLEEKRFERVGGRQSIDVDVRIVVATNRDLQKLAEEKQLREDLYFRISAVPMTIPPLRERGNDVLLLADHFLEKFSREFGKPGLELSDDARDRLLHYRWRGNVRELQNTLERAVILVDGLTIRPDGLQLPASKPDAVGDRGGSGGRKETGEGCGQRGVGGALARIDPANPGQNLAKIPAIEIAPQTLRRLCEFQDGDGAAGLEDALNLAQAGFVIGEIAETEGSSHQIKRSAGEREPESVGFEKMHWRCGTFAPQQRRRRVLLSCADEHGAR